MIGIEGLEGEEERALLTELYEWQTREEFRYRHHWEQGTLLMWDNLQYCTPPPVATKVTTACYTAPRLEHSVITFEIGPIPYRFPQRFI